MKTMFATAIAVIATAVWAASPAGTPMTSSKTAGQISIVPEPKLVNGELILKVVALNSSQKAATFGPEDIRISTADGKAVPIMSIDALIAQVKGAAQGGQASSGSYNSSYTSGPATTYNHFGQPDVHNFTGSSAPIGGQINPEAPVRTGSGDDPALAQQIENLKKGILQEITIAPGDVQGGEVVTERIKFHWREKHTLRIAVHFNGEEHDFELPAPPED
ncbi:MAG: hypothetical protein KGO22_20340 [Gammaproteobacteria bacterium]|nr:hypothetical protein [Gammaproteobacteria bacterium]